MIETEDVLTLYRQTAAHVRDLSSPFAHLNSPEESKAFGKYMEHSIIYFQADSVLDIGCGTGSPLMYVDPILCMDFMYTGADINKRFLKFAQTRFASNRNFRFTEYNIWDMNLQNTYDGIYIFEPFAYFNSAEICKMIDYYYTQADKYIAFSLCIPDPKRDPNLLIEQTEIIPIVNHVLTKYKYSSVARYPLPNKLIVTIAHRPFDSYARK